MRSQEHRVLGDDATGAALVDVGGVLGGEPLLLHFGDVVAMSGDYFVADGYPIPAESVGTRRVEALAADGLFHLAAVRGHRGEQPASRDEVICALQVMAADQGVTDARFEPGGAFEEFRASPSGLGNELVRRVRDRFLALGASNDEHFVAPGARGALTEADRPPARLGSATNAYRHLHQRALEAAWQLGRNGGELSQAMAREAAAQHYLTDAFAAGHVRTPVAALREFWQERYPWFWEGLQRKVASDTAAALRELLLPLAAVPRSTLDDRTLEAVRARTSGYPRISLGDLLAKVFHDWDNVRGLALADGRWLFGDGCLDQGVTRELALAAVRAGVDDVEVAFRLGASGTVRGGEALYGTVREATGAPADRFLAETKLPRLAPDNPPQNWRAEDVGALWEQPIVGANGPTVGEAVAEALETGEELPRRLETLGQGIAKLLPVPPIPALRRWLGAKAAHAYQRGFVGSLCADPKAAVLAVVAHADDPGPEPAEAPALR